MRPVIKGKRPALFRKPEQASVLALPIHPRQVRGVGES